MSWHVHWCRISYIIFPSANSVDPDQAALQELPDLGLLCLQSVKMRLCDVKGYIILMVHISDKDVFTDMLRCNEIDDLQCIYRIKTQVVIIFSMRASSHAKYLFKHLDI